MFFYRCSSREQPGPVRCRCGGPIQVIFGKCHEGIVWARSILMNKALWFTVTRKTYRLNSIFGVIILKNPKSAGEFNDALGDERIHLSLSASKMLELYLNKNIQYSH